jgi:hypothetical protein
VLGFIASRGRLLARCLALVAWSLGLAQAPAHAQVGEGLTWVPGASALECLRRLDDLQRPAYPERELSLKTPATVRVRLTFTRADAAPRIETTYQAGGDAFVEAVDRFVRAYRLPCLPSGAAQIVATQEFQFQPEDDRQVFFAGLRENPKTPETLRCVTGMRPPEYPINFASVPPEGTVVVELKFTDPTSPPEAKVLYNGSSPRLAGAVLAAVDRYRVPCLNAADGPLTARQSFTFALNTSTRYALNDVGLQQFLTVVDKLDQARIRFDFATMACPFEVRIRLYQPHAPNQVGELDRADPNRREFIEWLRGVSLKLPSDAARHVIGQSITVAVPCGVLVRP